MFKLNLGQCELSIAQSTMFTVALLSFFIVGCSLKRLFDVCQDFPFGSMQGFISPLLELFIVISHPLHSSYML